MDHELPSFLPFLLTPYTPSDRQALYLYPHEGHEGQARHVWVTYMVNVRVIRLMPISM